MDSTAQVVAALGAMDDAALARAVAAAAAGRPALTDLRSAALEAAARLWGTPARPGPGGGTPDGPGLDVPGPDVPVPTHPDLVDPSPDPVTGRAVAARGAAELDAESPEGRASAAAWDERARAGRARLEEIRRGMTGPG